MGVNKANKKKKLVSGTTPLLLLHQNNNPQPQLSKYAVKAAEAKAAGIVCPQCNSGEFNARGMSVRQGGVRVKKTCFFCFRCKRLFIDPRQITTGHQRVRWTTETKQYVFEHYREKSYAMIAKDLVRLFGMKLNPRSVHLFLRSHGIKRTKEETCRVLRFKWGELTHEGYWDKKLEAQESANKKIRERFAKKLRQKKRGRLDARMTVQKEQEFRDKLFKRINTGLRDGIRESVMILTPDDSESQK